MDECSDLRIREAEVGGELASQKRVLRRYAPQDDKLRGYLVDGYLVDGYLVDGYLIDGLPG
jgi:hypothetical protein